MAYALASIVPLVSFAAPVINPPDGRIAIVADGNSPDPDDIGGSAASIALLRASGLEGRLAHYSHCCDLVKNQTNISVEEEQMRHGLMQTSCDGTASRWGGFDGVTFWDAKDQQTQTVNELRDAINASSSTDPLWIIEAGEPDIIGYALDASDSTKHQFVKVVSHHPANDDTGDFYTWQEILDFGVEEVRIPDQNTNLQQPIATWDWAKNHSDSRIQWIWDQGKIAEQDPVVGFQQGKFDISDSGMVLYWITGANVNGGLSLGTVTDVRELLEDYVSGGLDLDTVISAADFDAESDPGNDSKIRISSGGTNIGYIQNNTWVRYNNVDFATGVGSIDVEAATPNAGGTIEVRVDSSTGPLLGSVSVTTTGGWGAYQTFSADLATPLGVRDMYLVFKGGGGGLLNLKSFILNSASMNVDDYTECCNEGQSYTFDTVVDVAYGASGQFNYLEAVTGTITFNNATFGDPIPRTVKKGYYRPAQGGTVGKAFTWDNGAENTYFKQVSQTVGGGTVTMTLETADNDPYVRMNNANVDGDAFTHVRIKAKNNTSGSNWRMYFKPSGGGEGGNSIQFSAPGDNVWHTYVLRMDADPDWTGMISSIRLDPEGGVAGTVEIDFVEIISAP